MEVSGLFPGGLAYEFILEKFEQLKEKPVPDTLEEYDAWLDGFKGVVPPFVYKLLYFVNFNPNVFYDDLLEWGYRSPKMTDFSGFSNLVRTKTVQPIKQQLEDQEAADIAYRAFLDCVNRIEEKVLLFEGKPRVEEDVDARVEMSVVVTTAVITIQLLAATLMQPGSSRRQNILFWTTLGYLVYMLHLWMMEMERWANFQEAAKADINATFGFDEDGVVIESVQASLRATMNVVVEKCLSADRMNTLQGSGLVTDTGELQKYAFGDVVPGVMRQCYLKHADSFGREITGIGGTSFTTEEMRRVEWTRTEAAYGYAGLDVQLAYTLYGMGFSSLVSVHALLKQRTAETMKEMRSANLLNVITRRYLYDLIVDGTATYMALSMGSRVFMIIPNAIGNTLSDYIPTVLYSLMPAITLNLGWYARIIGYLPMGVTSVYATYRFIRLIPNVWSSYKGEINKIGVRYNRLFEQNYREWESARDKRDKRRRAIGNVIPHGFLTDPEYKKQNTRMAQLRNQRNGLVTLLGEEIQGGIGDDIRRSWALTRAITTNSFVDSLLQGDPRKAGNIAYSSAVKEFLYWQGANPSGAGFAWFVKSRPGEKYVGPVPRGFNAIFEYLPDLSGLGVHQTFMNASEEDWPRPEDEEEYRDLQNFVMRLPEVSRKKAAERGIVGRGDRARSPASRRR